MTAVLKFGSHDDLVLAYQDGLLTQGTTIRTADPVVLGEQIEVRIELVAEGRSLDLLAIVMDPEHQKDETGEYQSRVLLQSEGGVLEQFILHSDPSSRRRSTIPAPNALTVVIVDDEAVQRESAARLFRERGDTVLTASDGLSGLALCLQHRPDVILSDVQMPKADGWQLLRMIRARKELMRTPVIFLTTLSSEKDRLLGYRLGVDDYLEKPCSKPVLLAHVERAVERARNARSLLPQASEVLRGDLEQVSLTAVLSFLELERKTGTLVLPLKGSLISIRDGRPIRAKTAQLDSRTCGQRAFFELLELTAGRFEFVSAGLEDEADTIKAPLSALLLEHARLSDEACRKGA